jgi:AraC-like DNA-binding protein
MQTKERTKIWHHAQLDIGGLRAYYVDHAFPRHSHDYYVISVIRRGLQSFTHHPAGLRGKGTKHFTPPGGTILINPGAVHTGETIDESGFEMVCLYPTTVHMQKAVFELTGREQVLPFFKEVRIDQPWVENSLLSMYRALTRESSPLECESRFTWTLAQLIKHFADIYVDEARPGHEREAVRQARRYIDERFAQGISLSQLAEHVSLSPYYLLRVFRAEVGMPPYAYLESVRIRQAQRLIETGKPLAEVAAETGFSSQSHLTHRFKQIIGVTPGHYARQLRD